MARYINNFQITGDTNALVSSLNNYLASEGYKYENFKGEDVFKKGTGFLSCPTFFKLVLQGSTLHLETWMKYAIFPGVFIGEFGVTGFVGSAAKFPWKKRITTIESMIKQFGYEMNANQGQSPAPSPAAQFQQNFNVQQGPSTPPGQYFCPRCSAPVDANVNFCFRCGQPVTKFDR